MTTRLAVLSVFSFLLVLALTACGLAVKTPTGTPLPTTTALATPAMTPTVTPAAEEEQYTLRRQRMVETTIRARGISDAEVLRAMETVPRHEFVLKEYLGQAYADHPLPIGYGQTISQPYIVALMTELLELKGDEKVLEIGTGSGYQAAVLAEIIKEVYSVEIIPELAQSAAERLKRLGYDNVKTDNRDGYYGWEEYAPFDAIIVTAAPDHVPQPLVNQLKDGGRLVIPVGPPGGYQTLWQITKKGEEIISRNITGVIFVPLTGEH
ncbi:MAG: protein-L-isoaspartate(D-aspartate) O-methyltransferase [Anaerolineae bacterium]